MSLTNQSFPAVTIIVLNWNAGHFLPDCLTALLDLNYPNFQVVVVDNNSSDDSVQLVRGSFPDVKLICSQANDGFAAGNNLALRQTEADFVVLVNPDVIVDADWLHHLILPMQADETIGITGSKLFYPERTLIQHAGGFITAPQALPGHYGLQEADTGQHDVPRDVDYVIGAALAVRREVIEQIGLMDEGFFLYFEECDYCLRAKRAGFRVVYVPEATAVHVESVTITRDNVAYFQTFHTSRWRYLLKHWPIATLLAKTIPVEATWLTTLPPIHRQGASHAYVATLKNLRPIWQARQAADLELPTPHEQTQLEHALRDLRQIAWRSPHLAADPNTASTLENKMVVMERPFTSRLPLLGKAAAWLRTVWGNIAMRHYVHALTQQQNEFNKLITTYFNEHQAKLAQQDTNRIDMIQALRTLQTQIDQVNEQLQTVETRLSRLAHRK